MREHSSQDGIQSSLMWKKAQLACQSAVPVTSLKQLNFRLLEKPNRIQDGQKRAPVVGFPSNLHV